MPVVRRGGGASALPGLRFGPVPFPVTGSRRTAEELGRAFPGVPVLTSAGDGIKDRVAPGPSIVVATPGAEPVVDGGYGAALLLDGYVLLARPDLRAGEETMRRWMAAAALVRPAGEGGRVVVGADSGLAAVQALIRWDPAGLAGAELDARRELGFPPAVAMAAVDGTEGAVASGGGGSGVATVGADPRTGSDGRDAASDGPVRGIAARGACAGTDLACRSEGAGRGLEDTRRWTFRPEGRGWTAHRGGPGRMGLIGHADHCPDARPSRDGGRRWLA